MLTSVYMYFFRGRNKFLAVLCFVPDLKQELSRKAGDLETLRFEKGDLVTVKESQQDRIKVG